MGKRRRKASILLIALKVIPLSLYCGPSSTLTKSALPLIASAADQSSLAMDLYLEIPAILPPGPRSLQCFISLAVNRTSMGRSLNRFSNITLIRDRNCEERRRSSLPKWRFPERKLVGREHPTVSGRHPKRFLGTDSPQ